jgi:hypothetical protein
MHTHRFGRKLKLPSTIAIKHQLRRLMAQDEVKTAPAEAMIEPANQPDLSQMKIDPERQNSPSPVVRTPS